MAQKCPFSGNPALCQCLAQGNQKKRKRSGCYASLPEAQLGAGGSTSDNLADVTRVWSFLGPRREILTLPLAAEQYGELISCICLASSL